LRTMQQTGPVASCPVLGAPEPPLPGRPPVGLCVAVAHHAADRARGVPDALSLTRRRLPLRHRQTTPGGSVKPGTGDPSPGPFCCSSGNARRARAQRASRRVHSAAARATLAGLAPSGSTATSRIAGTALSGIARGFGASAAGLGAVDSGAGCCRLAGPHAGGEPEDPIAGPRLIG
jgi:hypothetical protein